MLTRLTRADAQDVLSSLRLAGVTARMTPASRRRSVGAPLARWGTAAAALLLISGAIAYRTSRARSPLSAVEIGALASASTGSLRCDDSIGSGFFVTDSRVVTNAHVVCEGEPIKVSLADGREFEGTTVAVDYRHDLAVVAVKGAKVTPLPLGDATRMRRGDEVYFFGSPKGLEFTLSKAIVSHDARQARGIPYLQLDGNVNPGNSGGPVIDQSGQVVGIVTLKVEGAEGLGFAVPVNFLHRQFEEQPLPPAADVDQEAWERRLAAAKERDDKDFAEIAPKLETGLLQAVVLNRRGELTAFELRLRPRSTARRAWVAVDFVRGERLVCSAEGYGDWLPLESVAIQWIDRETRAWLQSHDVDRRLHGAVVKLQSDSCTFADLMGVAAYVRGDREMPVPLRFAEDE
ncbi:MAG TPA: trypsin-like peptidase domain-containing protein [Thermoanaerobaculia bacterium]|nr:trypsin-like peptidase domain-containing protein [Thermoanaerobaculia bacterium]